MSHHHRRPDHEDHDDRELLRRILEKLEELLDFLKHSGSAATEFTFENTGEDMPTNFTVTPGASGQVTATPNGAMQAGAVPVWTVDDTSVSLTPDSTGLIIAFATSASDTAASFNLTLTGVNSVGATISSTQNIAFAGGSGGSPATGFTFVQNS